MSITFAENLANSGNILPTYYKYIQYSVFPKTMYTIYPYNLLFIYKSY